MRHQGCPVNAPLLIFNDISEATNTKLYRRPDMAFTTDTDGVMNFDLFPISEV